MVSRNALMAGVAISYSDKREEGLKTVSFHKFTEHHKVGESFVKNLRKLILLLFVLILYLSNLFKKNLRS